MAVLFISGYPDGEVERGGLTNGGATYLEKPFSPRMLRDTVRQALADVGNSVGKRVIHSGSSHNSGVGSND
jgi:FixJ family two-component response regulator